MTFNYEDNNRNLSSRPNSSNINNYQEDYFELLSAYLDGELEPAECAKVQQWLDEEPEIKRVYTQLLQLQSQMQNSAVPPSTVSTDELSARVFSQLEKTKHKQRSLVWCGGAIAAAVLAAMSGIVPGISFSSLKMVKSPAQTNFSAPIMLAVAVNKPAINIPKAATTYPRNNINSITQ